MRDNYNKGSKKYALILAGGKGTRLWPISTINKPKQYLSLYSKNIMINETIKRVETIFKCENYYWNSGIFIWKITTILKNFKTFLPDIYKYKEEIINNFEKFEMLEHIYNEVNAISIDYGILEKSNNIKMIKGKFEWMDIGNVNDFFKIKKKNWNSNKGQFIENDTNHCNIYNDDKDTLIATLGVDNLNIIKSNKVIFVASKDKMTELPKLIKKMENNYKLKKYL